MVNINSKHCRSAFVSPGISASAFSPLLLLLLPKCPLCLLPLLAFLGVAMPASMGPWIAAGIVVAVWLTILLVAARRHPLVLTVACASAGVGVVAIALHSRPLLWTAVFAMTATGFALVRTCPYRGDLRLSPDRSEILRSVSDDARRLTRSEIEE